MTKSYRVVLIEDEELARELFKQLINESNGVFEVIGEAANGKAGYTLIQSLKPDFVVTDISMPVWTGLDLIHEMKQTMKELPQTIILTCHQDFHYAQQAVHLGASSYLLKDDCLSDTGLLIRTLISLVPSVIDHAEKQRKQAELETKLRTNEISINRNSLLSTMRKSAKEWQSYLSQTLRVPMDNSHQYLFLVEFDRKSLRFMEAEEPEQKLWEFAGVNVLQELLQQHGYANVVAVNVSRFLCICALTKHVPELASDISDSLNRYLKINSFVHCHQAVTSLIEAEQAVKQLLKEHLLFFYEPHKITVHPQMPESPHELMSTDQKSDWCKILREAMYSSTLLANEMKHLAEEARQKQWRPQDILGICTEVLLNIKLTQSESAGSSLRLQTLLHHLGTCQTMRQIVDVMLLEFASQNQKTVHSAAEQVVLQKIELMNADMSQSYSLEEMAASVGYSAPYFSRTFKKVVGENFSQYLMHIRIQKAKQLLLTTDMRTFEVSYQVGIENYRNFNKIFKKIVGMSPNQYRIYGKTTMEDQNI
ncbi:response regulator transcription factor [Paenibacillus roseipurpureus]|uniref:Response regulator n=1 Tax=Paenibacillus roseopurpureus TaxID=2918901 RepID=A0AA96RK50_9BACL|nr:helix-turn-helix domain-containing protein [Paenibacillus sp. MBLB1832]WNR46068.1 response regulator [Paenibacillus sp. MBLB1832]